MTKHSRWIITALLALSVLTLTTTAWAQTTQPAGNTDEFKPVQPQLVNAPAGNAAAPIANATGNGANNQAGNGATQPAKSQDPFGSMTMWIVLIGGFILLYWWSNRSRRKQEAKRKEMLSSLKKGDKVTSIGGIIGTVIEVREDEVTVKVDETNNVRMRFARWAIRGVGEEAKTETEKK
jgi:preprotein translocase subunit YajC